MDDYYERLYGNPENKENDTVDASSTADTSSGVSTEATGTEGTEVTADNTSNKVPEENEPVNAELRQEAQNTQSAPAYGYGAPSQQMYGQPVRQATNAGGYPVNTQFNTVPPFSSKPYIPGMPPVMPQPAPQNPKKSSGKVGKSIFIGLLCVCLVVASICVGFAIRDNTMPSPGNQDSTSASAADGSSGNDASLTNNPDAPSVTISQTPAAGGTAKTSGLAASDVYSRVEESNVGILIYSNSSLAGEGSGVIMGEDSTGRYTYIITCAHVISDVGVSVRVQFSDDSDIDAEIVGYDTRTDIGVVRVEKTGLKAAEFGDATALAVGQTVYAIGNPGGTEFFGSFTSGMISAIDRPVDSSVGYSQPCVQHSAAINPGNSGGALVNEYGQVIGINSSKIADTDYEGMGFAVPIDTVKEVVDEIVSHGYVANRPKLGISYSPVSYSQMFSIIVQANDLPAGSIIIKEIDSESNLNGKNVQVNDMIIAANGQDLTTTNTLPEMIESMSVGDTITLTVCRVNNDYSIGTPFDVDVTLIEDKPVATVPEETTAYSFNPFGYGY